MEKENISRRDFLKGASIVGAGAAANAVFGNPIGNGITELAKGGIVPDSSGMTSNSITKEGLSTYDLYLFDENNKEVMQPSIYDTNIAIPCRIEKYENNGFIIRYISVSKASGGHLSSHVKTHHKSDTSLVGGGLYLDKSDPVIYSTVDEAMQTLPKEHYNFLEYIEEMCGKKDKYSKDEISNALKSLNVELVNKQYGGADVTIDGKPVIQEPVIQEFEKLQVEKPNPTLHQEQEKTR